MFMGYPCILMFLFNPCSSNLKVFSDYAQFYLFSSSRFWVTCFCSLFSLSGSHDGPIIHEFFCLLLIKIKYNSSYSRFLHFKQNIIYKANQDCIRCSGFSKTRHFPDVGHLKSPICNIVCLDFSSDVCSLAEYLTSLCLSQLISKTQIKIILAPTVLERIKWTNSGMFRTMPTEEHTGNVRYYTHHYEQPLGLPSLTDSGVLSLL